MKNVMTDLAPPIGIDSGLPWAAGGDVLGAACSLPPCPHPTSISAIASAGPHVAHRLPPESATVGRFQALRISLITSPRESLADSPVRRHYLVSRADPAASAYARGCRGRRSSCSRGALRWPRR